MVIDIAVTLTDAEVMDALVVGTTARSAEEVVEGIGQDGLATVKADMERAVARLIADEAAITDLELADMAGDSLESLAGRVA